MSIRIKIKATVTAIVSAVALLLAQGCSTAAPEPPPVDVTEQAPVYTPMEGLSSQQRFQQILSLLEEGLPVPARAELLVYLEDLPESRVAQDLLDQIDLPVYDYFPKDFHSIELASGQSLSTLADKYLGSVYQFYALAKYNAIARPRAIKVGQWIRVPLTKTARQVIARESVETGMIPASTSAESIDEAAMEPLESPADAAGEEPMAPAVGATMEPAEYAADAGEEPAESAPGATMEPIEPAPDVPGGADELPSGDVRQSEPAPTYRESPLAEAQRIAERADELYRSALDAYRSQDLDKAIDLWDQVLELDPGYENARIYRSQAMELRNKLTELN